MPRRHSIRQALIRAAMVLALLEVVGPIRGGEWPQILGPARNGKADGEKLSDHWPAAGPRVVWQREVGSGLAGLAVVRGRALLFHRVEDQSLVEALDAATGAPLWKRRFPASYSGGFHGDNGPRCVPLVHGDAVYLATAEGDLHCLALDNGQPRWSRAAAREFDAPLGYFGVGSCPIVESDRLLWNVGGKSGAGIVCFALSDGKTLWKASQEAASYSSPVAATVGGQRQVIFVARLSVVAVEPRSGRVLFQFPFGRSGPTVNAANPLVLGDRLFVTANYGIGAQLRRLDRPQAEPLWTNDDALSCQFSTPIEQDGFLYGVDGRQDQGVARLRCVEVASGKVRWTEEGFGMAALLWADGKLLAMKTDGEALLLRATPRSVERLARARLFDSTVQALPALAAGRLFARDEHTVKCFDLNAN